MKYLKEHSFCGTTRKTHIEFTSGATTEDEEVAYFFDRMEDLDAPLERVRRFINNGYITGYSHKHPEIERVFQTFKQDKKEQE